jgi:hypothetical protein
MEDLFTIGVGAAIVSGEGTPTECAGGGSLTQSCTEVGDEAKVNYLFDACVTVMDGIAMRVDGQLNISTNGTCDAPFPLDQTATATFDGTIEKNIVDTPAAFSVVQDVMMTFRLESDGTTRFTVNGFLDASCVSGVATVQTLEPVVTGDGAICPTVGEFLIVLDGVEHKIRYTESGGVVFDVGADNVLDAVYPTCDDPLIEQCFQ